MSQANAEVMDETDRPIAIVNALQELQLPHAKLLYILARMYKLQMITETQKLELKCKYTKQSNLSMGEAP